MKAAIKHQTGNKIFLLPIQFLPLFNHTIYVSRSILKDWWIKWTQIQYLLQAYGKNELFILIWGCYFFHGFFLFPTNELSFSNIEIYHWGNAPFHDFSIISSIQEMILPIFPLSFYLERNLDKNTSVSKLFLVLHS